MIKLEKRANIGAISWSRIAAAADTVVGSSLHSYIVFCDVCSHYVLIHGRMLNYRCAGAEKGFSCYPTRARTVHSYIIYDLWGQFETIRVLDTRFCT